MDVQHPKPRGVLSNTSLHDSFQVDRPRSELPHGAPRSVSCHASKSGIDSERMGCTRRLRIVTYFLLAASGSSHDRCVSLNRVDEPRCTGVRP